MQARRATAKKFFNLLAPGIGPENAEPGSFMHFLLLYGPETHFLKSGFATFGEKLNRRGGFGRKNQVRQGMVIPGKNQVKAQGQQRRGLKRFTAPIARQAGPSCVKGLILSGVKP